MNTTLERFRTTPPSRRIAHKPQSANRWCDACGCGVTRRPGAASTYVHPETGVRLTSCPECFQALKVRTTPFSAYPETRLQDDAWNAVQVEEIETGEGTYEHFGRVETHRATGLALRTHSFTVDVTGYDRASLPDYLHLSVEGLPVRVTLRRVYLTTGTWRAVYGVEVAL